MNEVTSILSQVEAGDLKAANQLLPLVYEELRKLAAARLAQEKPGHTLQATALVHEAYLRLVGQKCEPRSDREDSDAQNSDNAKQGKQVATYSSRGHFFSAAAEAMRRILIDQARRKHADKRGGQLHRLPLTDLPDESNGDPLDLFMLDQALSELSKVDPQAAELVKLRYFAGLSIDDTAMALGISPRTADRTWLFARTWLFNKLKAAGS